MIKLTTPALLIGDAMRSFLKETRGVVTPYLVHSADNPVKSLERVLSDYGHSVYGDVDLSGLKPLILGDLTYFSERMLVRLLKFIEESSVPIICLASQDFRSDILFSRFRQIVKVTPPFKYGSVSWRRPSVAVDEVEVSLGSSYSDVAFNEWSAVNCPVLPILKSRIGDVGLSERKNLYKILF